MERKKIRISQQGSSPWVVVIVLFLIVVICACAWVVVEPAINRTFDVNRAILNKVEEQEIAVVMEVRKISMSPDIIEKMKNYGYSESQIQTLRDLDGAIEARIVLMDGSGRCIPIDCGWVIILKSMIDPVCGEPKTFRFIAIIVNPTVHAMEAGTKTNIVHYVGLRAIGENMCEQGEMYQFEDESHGTFDFLTNILGQNIDKLRSIPNCQLGVWSGGKYSIQDCFSEQYNQTQILVGMGPVPGFNEQGLYLYTVTALGMNMINTADFPELFALRTMFRNAEVLTKDDLQQIDAYLMQIDSSSLRINTDQ